MATERSEACSWPSIKNPGSWVTANQYIMELLFINEARHNNKDLPRQFWKLPQWGDKKWASHGGAVSKLLKVYEPKAIINAVKARNLFSLRSKWVENLVRKEQKKLNAKRKAKKTEKASKPNEDFQPIIENRRRPHRPSKFVSLLALDNEKENGEKNSKKEG